MLRTMLVVALAVTGPARAWGAELRVAVLDFVNASPDKDLDSLGKGLQSMVTTDLSQVDTFKLIERERLRDLQNELALGRSGLVDKATAARVGKLLGATHLVAGTFTVVGTQMRIDGRMFAVADGAVLLADKIEGERDAFFELEKALVQKIIDAAGVKLTPRERGVVNRVHTVDYEAFRSFSRGVALFDQQQYDEALAALRAAQSRDAEFKLATVTLSEYQQILAKIRSRADELESSEAQLERLERHKGASGDGATIQKLYAIADRRAKRDPIDRLTALYMLAVALGNVDDNGGDVSDLHKVEDRFALSRSADALVKSYYVEAVELFPKLPPVVRDQFDVRLPRAPETFEQGFARARASLLAFRPGGCRPEKTHELSMLCALEWRDVRDDPVHQFPRRLYLDARATADLHMKLYELGVKLNAPAEWRVARLRELAEEYRAAGAVDRSTALYQAIAGMLTDPERVREAADEIEKNKRAAEALARSPFKDVLRELLILGGEVDAIADHAASRELPSWLVRSLGKLRSFPSDGRWGRGNGNQYVLIGDVPVWKLWSGQFTLGTGPRGDLYRADAIRHALRGRDDDKVEDLVVVEGVPRRDVKMSFDVVWDAPPDFYTVQEERLPASPGVRPEIGILFAARDVEVDAEKDREGKEVLVRPMRASVLFLRPDGVELVDLVESARGGNGHAGAVKQVKRFARTTRAKQAAPLGAGKLAVAVDISGEVARLTVNGKPVEVRVPAERTGFYGFVFGGPGYVEVKGIKVRR